MAMSARLYSVVAIVGVNHWHLVPADTPLFPDHAAMQPALCGQAPPNGRWARVFDECPANGFPCLRCKRAAGEGQE